VSWFQLDARSVAERVQSTGRPVKIPSLGASLARGMIGFTMVSVAGFAPWAIWGRWFHRNVGEAGLYAVCALVFMVTAGLLLAPLIIGPGSLSRFYKVFSLAFAAYSVAWIAGWMSLRGHAGSIVGLLAGTILMGGILARAFDATDQMLKTIAALFVLNTAGYFIGGWVEAAVISLRDVSVSRAAQAMIAKSLWGVFYGLGFGAGLGLAFHFCQTRARALLLAGSAPGAAPASG
jgi:hypothetical protein